MHRTLPAAVRLLAAFLVFLLSEVAHDEGGLGAGLASVAASTAILLLCSAVQAAAVSRTLPPSRVRTSLREAALRTAFLPQRDPDAAGRPRPRAPGRRLVTAA